MNNQELALLTEYIFNRLFVIAGIDFPVQYKGVLYMLPHEPGLEDFFDIEYYQCKGHADFGGYQKFRETLETARKNNLQVLDYSTEGLMTFSNQNKFDINRIYIDETFPLDRDDIEIWIGQDCFDIEELKKFAKYVKDLLNDNLVQKDDWLTNQNLDGKMSYQDMYSIYESFSRIYKNANENVKNHIEFSLGAGLSYLPTTNKESWNGYVGASYLYQSITENLHGSELIKVHDFTRETAAKELLNNKFTFEEFCKIIDSKYKKFSYDLIRKKYPPANRINIKDMGIEYDMIKKFTTYCGELLGSIDGVDEGKLSNPSWTNEQHFINFETKIKEMAQQFLGKLQIN